MLVHIRQPYFSIINATIFGLLGLAYGLSSHLDVWLTLNNFPKSGPIMMISGAEISASVGFVVSGVCFIMAYFSLVHLKYR